jgi:hypothetical protein
MVAFSGFYESHEPPPSGNVRGIVRLHRIAMAIKKASKDGTFFIVVLLIVSMAAAGAIQSE